MKKKGQSWEDLNKCDKAQNSNISLAYMGMTFAIMLIGAGMSEIFSKDNNSSYVWGPILLILSMVAFCISCIVVSKSARKKKNLLYKELVADEAARKMFEDYEFYPDIGFSEASVIEKGILDSHVNFVSEDLLRGKCRGVAFTRAEVRCGFFKGEFIVFKTDEDYSDKIRIVSRDLTNATERGTEKDDEHLTKVETGDASFDEIFRCFGEDAVSVRVMLSKETKEMLLSIRKKLDYPFSILFSGNEVTVAIETGENQTEMPKHLMDEKTEAKEARKDFVPIQMFAEFVIRDRAIMPEMPVRTMR